METLLAELQRLGVRLQLDNDELRIFARAGSLDDRLRQALRTHKPAIVAALRANTASQADAMVVLTHDAPGRFAPFPLTELQHAYWLGRDTALEMGSVATHLYVELSCEGFDVGRANRALCDLIGRHDMLRAIVDGEGRQRVLRDVPAYAISQADFRADAGAAEAAALATRDALSHQVLKADRWPLFDIRATLMPRGEVRLHVSLDLLILDAWSIFLFFREWHALYVDPTAGARPGIGYRDYVLAQEASRDGAVHARARAYWDARLDHLPLAPALPLRALSSTRQATRFHRREHRLDSARWKVAKDTARGRGLTPSGVMLAAYAEVLARWSSSAHFTLNVTTGSREPWHADVHQLLGDFTSLVLHEVDRRDANASFADFAALQQARLLEDLDHSAYSGLSVRREWARRRGITAQAALPVVFSSGLIWSGDEEVGHVEQFGNKVYSISQTSQVWLDHHVMELDGDLVLIWDAAEAVFEPDVLDAMFAAYVTLVTRLADDATVWAELDAVPLPASMQRARGTDAQPAAAASKGALHAGVVSCALANPERVALIAADRTLTFGQWLVEASHVANKLLAAMVQPGEPVAIISRKGWEQPVAVLGTLLSGAAYVPIDADLPVQRQIDLLVSSGARNLLSPAGVARPELMAAAERCHSLRAGESSPYEAAHARSLRRSSSELAYIIFTSGTTGVPKGVMIEHGAAANTVESINNLFGVGETDRVLGVSSLSFDLSVYDIFGVPGVGGALVLPDANKGHDPAHWLDLLLCRGVTVWNSAPQLMQMLVDTLGPDDRWLAALRTVMLSGDFIPLDLPARLRSHGCHGRISSLGGATEASIWSVHYPIGDVDPAWRSIPYGRALPHQTITVLDESFRPVPDHVRGRIFIGGGGLARGYHGDADKTARAFFPHPRTGQRLYATGDVGKFDPSGEIVILGRDDGQVKIRGHRVELGEIEAVLRRHAAVEQAVVALNRRVTGGAASLVAFLVPAQQVHAASAFDGPAIRQHLVDALPDYMVPAQLVVVDQLPLSSNGKVDLDALLKLADDGPEHPPTTAPRNDFERSVLAAWQRVIPDADFGVTENFFELGGDSVMATQLLRELNTGLQVPLEMHELFENLTVESLARLLSERDAPGAADVALRAAATSALADEARLWADLDRAREGVHQAIAASACAGPDGGAIETVLVTGATGWVGAHLVAELLERSSAHIVCVVRGSSDEAARARLIDVLNGVGGLGSEALPSAGSALGSRLSVFCGDLTEPLFGWSTAQWQARTCEIDAVYHLAASVGVLHDYASHFASNVAPLHALLQLANEGRRRAIFAMSPMTVCRRWVDGRLEVHGAESVMPSPRGLLTPYAQSKWLAEGVLWAAAGSGAPVRIYRCSHALPAARGGAGKLNDSYAAVLEVASAVNVLPDWPDARLHGMPVDQLCRLLVADSLAHAAHSDVIHLDVPLAPLLRDVIEALVPQHHGAVPPATVPLHEWQQRCLEAASELPAARQALARALFERNGDRWPIENIFSSHAIATRWPERHECSDLPIAPPREYWARAFPRSEVVLSEEAALS
jgi:pyochelin synthetase